MSSANLEPIVHGGDLFSGLRPEEEHERDRGFEVRKSDGVEKIIEEFKWSLNAKFRQDVFDEIYHKVRVYDSKDIEEFSVLASNLIFDSNKSYILGYFISSLINKSRDSEFVIHTKHFDSPPVFIGYKNNGKTIIIDGDAGEYTGYKMRGGRIIVNGNSEPLLGSDISGGEIIVNGNAANVIGDSMNGGKIIINGDSREYIGIIMTGGEIHLNGDYVNLHESIRGGDIYHNGKLLIKKGTRTWRYSISRLLGWEK